MTRKMTVFGAIFEVGVAMAKWSWHQAGNIRVRG